MVVGVSRLVLVLPGVKSLKEKRAQVRRVVDRTANRFNAAVSEVGAQDLHQRAELGVAVVSNEAAHCDRMLAEIANFVETLHPPGIQTRSTQVIHTGKVSETAKDVLGSWEQYEDPS